MPITCLPVAVAAAPGFFFPGTGDLKNQFVWSARTDKAGDVALAIADTPITDANPRRQLACRLHSIQGSDGYINALRKFLPRANAIAHRPIFDLHINDVFLPLTRMTCRPTF
jgi:hypothetical protein